MGFHELNNNVSRTIHSVSKAVKIERGRESWSVKPEEKSIQEKVVWEQNNDIYTDGYDVCMFIVLGVLTSTSATFFYPHCTKYFILKN